MNNIQGIPLRLVPINTLKTIAKLAQSISVNLLMGTACTTIITLYGDQNVQYARSVVYVDHAQAHPTM